MAAEQGTVRQIGRYEVIRKIATGGMAELFLARFVGPGGFEKRCALKRILPQFAADQTFTRMFLNEARVTAMFDHPNLVQIFELGQDEHGQFFIAMELVNGVNLRQLLHLASERNIRIPPELAAFMMTQALDGLAYAHTFRDPDGRPLNLVHRDISPQNILVSYEGAVKLVDFGIVKGASISGETQAGMLKGKISYMSPEQASGEPMDGRSDLFSLGVCFYELVAQERPFQAINELMTLKAILEKPPLSLTSYVPEIPDTIERAIYTSLEKSPADRFRSARDFHMELSNILRACPTPIGRHVVADFLKSLTEGSTVRFDASRLRIPRRTRTAGFGMPSQPNEPLPTYHTTPPKPAPTPPGPRDRAPTVPPSSASSPSYRPPPAPGSLAEPEITSISKNIRAAGLERPPMSVAVVLIFLFSALAGAAVVWFATQEPETVVVEFTPDGKERRSGVAVIARPPPEAAPIQTTPVEKKPVEKKPVEKKPVEKKPVEKKPVEKKPVEKKPVAVKKRVEAKKPTEAKPVEKKPKRITKRTRRSPKRAAEPPAPPPPPPPPPPPRPAVAKGRLKMTSVPSGLFVTEGSKQLGTTPLDIELKPGAHKVVLSSKRHGIRRELRLSINASTTHEERIVVPRGTVKIISRPWAVVFVNNKERGKTPLQIPVYEGKHVIRLENPDQGSRSQTFVMRGNTDELITVKF